MFHVLTIKRSYKVSILYVVVALNEETLSRGWLSSEKLVALKRDNIQMEELIDTEDDIAEIDDDFQIVVSGWSVYVESLNLTLRQGIACVWDAEEGLFMPDFDVTIVYEGNIETQEWLYYEQDGMVVTLGNWLNGRLSCEQIEQLWCELIIPEQNKEQKESEE